MSISLANQHLDQAVGEEIGKTINVLNEYVSKVQLSQKLNDDVMRKN